MKKNYLKIILAYALLGTGLVLAPNARSHCDTMDGPVIQDAKAALEKKDVTPVLKWVKKDVEGEVRNAFAQTLAVRTKGPEVQALADRFFFETLVRVHRAGEGAPFTGLKPAGTETEPGIAMADQALKKNSVADLTSLLAEDVAAGVRARYAEVLEKQKHAQHSVQAGREFVAAYVEYVHYVENLHRAIQGTHSHEAPAAMKAKPGEDHHVEVERLKKSS